jgi:hypothetical protein
MIFLEEEFSDAVTRLQTNPLQTDEILILLLGSIRKGTLYQILNVEQRVHEIANSNPVFSQKYIRKYVELCNDLWVLAPPSVHFFLSDNIGPLIPAVSGIDHSLLHERLIKMHFFRALIQKCDSNCKNLSEMQVLAERLAEIAESTPFVINPYKPGDLGNYNSLVDKSLHLIEDIEDRAQYNVHYYQICRNLSRCSILKGYVELFLIKCIRDQRFSSLLWLLAENSELHDAYLCEFERGLQLYESLPNEKHTTIGRIKKEIKNQLENNEDFGDFLSELLIMNKFGSGQILVKDKKIGKKFIDLEIRLRDKKVLFEIRAPEMQRDSTITGVGFLRNKFDDAIIDKRRQLKEGLDQNLDPLITPEDILFYVVIDGSKTPIAHDCMDLFVNENQENDLVSGVIVFRPINKITKAHHLSLSGWIKNNPKGRNVLSPDELTELSQILFS